ncbi:MAG: hypothetical protein QOK04_1139 [Solirubrobacteraceae bacterium]|jgi:hypothetical protein|nr:hypothetical protein [Solirubrobacteraceae bacterium]
MDQFLENGRLTMDCREVEIASTPWSKITDDPWATGHYRCALSGDGASTVSVTVGCDDGPPGIEDVIAVLGAEAATVEAARSFEEWATALSYNPDSRHAERIYRAARRRARSLRDLIGDERYRGLLRESEDNGLGIAELVTGAREAGGAA